MKQKNYSKEFKVLAVKMIIEEDLSVRKISKDLGVSENLLYKWKKQYLEEQSNIFKDRQRPETERIRQLKTRERKCGIKNEAWHIITRTLTGRTRHSLPGSKDEIQVYKKTQKPLANKRNV